MTRTTHLAEFLLARIAEDERLAQAGIARARAWAPDLPPWEMTRYLGKFSTNLDHHIARWSPDRVLAECESRRRIVEMYAEVAQWDDPENSSEHATGRAVGLGEAVRLMALPYSGHPDYRAAEWEPESGR